MVVNVRFIRKSTDVNVASMVQSPFEALDAYAHGQPYAGEVQL